MTYSSTPSASPLNYQQPEFQPDSPPLLSRAKRRLIETGATIILDAPIGDDLMFSHSIFCNVGLPRRRIASREFERSFGAARLSVQAGLLDEGDGPVPQPVPYGALPRLALALITTLAIRHQSKKIDIGRSAAEFLRLLGIDSQGNRYRTLRLQLHALIACHLQFGFRTQTFDGTLGVWGQSDCSAATAWPGTLVLTDALYEELINHCVPLDRRAFHQLKGSALAIDIYSWFAYRLHQIVGSPIQLSWRALQSQFGQDYTGANAESNFQKSFLHALAKVRTVYPQAKVQQFRGGLKLHSSPPPVAKRFTTPSSPPRHAQRDSHAQPGGRP